MNPSTISKMLRRTSVMQQQGRLSLQDTSELRRMISSGKSALIEEAKQKLVKVANEPAPTAGKLFVGICVCRCLWLCVSLCVFVCVQFVCSFAICYCYVLHFRMCWTHFLFTSMTM